MAGRSWIFPRDPDFEAKAGRVLDLYAREWEGQPLDDGGYVLSADEKTSIQARIRRHLSLPAAPGRGPRTEFEYTRGGALQYLAAWDVHRAKIFGRCEPATGIEPFGRLLSQVMTTEPYASARRVFWVIDNGSSHRGQASIDRAQGKWPTVRLVHLPVHASWINQVEIYFSVIHRKVLTPSDFTSLAEVQERLLAFERRYEQAAAPFEWKFTRHDLTLLMKKTRQPAQLPGGMNPCRRAKMNSMRLVLVLDCHDPARLAQFWAETIGYRQSSSTEGLPRVSGHAVCT